MSTNDETELLGQAMPVVIHTWFDPILPEQHVPSIGRVDVSSISVARVLHHVIIRSGIGEVGRRMFTVGTQRGSQVFYLRGPQLDVVESSLRGQWSGTEVSLTQARPEAMKAFAGMAGPEPMSARVIRRRIAKPQEPPETVFDRTLAVNELWLGPTLGSIGVDLSEQELTVFVYGRLEACLSMVGASYFLEVQDTGLCPHTRCERLT